jgi:hypothetical protein
MGWYGMVWLGMGYNFMVWYGMDIIAPLAILWFYGGPQI